MQELDTTAQTTQLLDAGQRALAAGDTIEARNLFRQITEIDPQHTAAWLGIARSVRPYQEKKNLLERVLAIDPHHREAQALLAEVNAQLAAGELLAPRILPLGVAEAEQTSAAPVELLSCYRHADRETGLRCTQCSNPICVECTRPAAVGQLCPDCAAERRPRNYKVSTTDMLLAGGIALGAGILASVGMILILFQIAFFALLIAFIAAPAYGELLVRLLDQATRAKRGQQMQAAAGIGLALGMLPALLLAVFSGGWTLLTAGVFIFIAISTVVARLR